MSEYKVGTLTAANMGVSVECVVQSLNYSFTCDTAETQDENGNVKYVQQYNHRAEGQASTRIPLGVEVPAQGASLTVKGISLPSYTSAGVASGGYTLDNTGSGVGVTFLVTDASIATTNTEVAQWDLSLVRYLENGIGAQTTSAVTSGVSQ